MATQRLTDWFDGDRLSASHLQEAVDMLRELSGTTGAGATEVLRLPNGTSHYTPEAEPGGAKIFRMKVTTTAAAPDTVLAKLYDGTKVTGDEMPVRTYWLREVDEEVYAYRPIGGTDAIYNNAAVTLLELWTPPRLAYDGMTLVQEGGQWVGAFTQAPALPTL